MKALVAATLLLALPALADEPNPQVFARFSQWTKARVAAKEGKVLIARSLSDGPAGAAEPMRLSATPSTPITDEKGATYQGVRLAIVGADRAGNVTGPRAVRNGFRTGERFKVVAMSTFGALLVIENINARGERRQIYPAEGGSVVVLEPGADAVLPLGEKQFFQFAGAAGEEQLVVSLRDPRAMGDAASRQRVFRVDDEDGTFFVQEVAEGSFARISESIRLEHR